MRSNHTLLLAGFAGLVVLGGCNKAPQTETAATAETVATAARADADAAAATAAVQKKEAELAQREADIAAREADAAAATAKAANSRSAAKPVVASKPAATSKPTTPVASAPAAAPLVLTVPSGTQLSLSLATVLSSKTAKVGDAVRARVTQDVRVNEHVAIAAGTTVAGQVTDVISGSNKIGGVPTLGLRFERLELPGGVDVPIDGVLTQQGKSDTARDTVKIVGGAAAGAILGHQIKGGDKGKVLELAIALAAPVQITRR